MALRIPGRGSVGAIVLCVLLSACGFEHGSLQPVDASVDSPDGPPPGPAASCKALHEAMPTAPSSNYVIDPDGAGPDAPIMVDCDMTSDGGGWTIVFVAPTSNMSALPSTYTGGTARLLADASRALLAYRDSTLLAAPNFASFDLPMEWRTNLPLNSAMTDVTTMVSVGGAAPVATTLRYGFLSFTGYCVDPWITNIGSWGRICLTYTNAPFFAGFATTSDDTCADSQSSYSAASCTNDRRFSIAVR